jgi:superfamily II RNA helicase
MKKVLEETDDGVVVFVAPTKSLVNQVAAEVYGKFKKNTTGGRSVYGIFTSDFKYKERECQVLVTVPSCLQILLLSSTPGNQTWKRKLQVCFGIRIEF